MRSPAAAAPAKRMCMVPERAKLHLAMTIFQFGYAGNHVIMRTALNMGVSKLVFPLYRNIIAVIVLVPFAYFLEKYVINLFCLYTTQGVCVYICTHKVCVYGS